MYDVLCKKNLHETSFIFVEISDIVTEKLKVLYSYAIFVLNIGCIADLGEKIRTFYFLV